MAMKEQTVDNHDEHVITLHIEPMSTLDRVRFWLARRLLPDGFTWTVAERLDPATISERIDEMREVLTATEPCGCMCHDLSSGLGMSHAEDCCRWAGWSRRRLVAEGRWRP